MKRVIVFSLYLPLLAMGPLTPINEAGFQKLVESHKGKVVLYDFWATWCGSCRAELPELVLLERRLRARGLEVVTISADDRKHQAAAEKFMWMFDVQGTAYIEQAADEDRFLDAIDPKWGGALPALFLYDRAGHKVRSFIGETNMATLERAVQKLL